jgi:hypothetical protein
LFAFARSATDSSPSRRAIAEYGRKPAGENGFEHEMDSGLRGIGVSVGWLRRRRWRRRCDDTTATGTTGINQRSRHLGRYRDKFGSHGELAGVVTEDGQARFVDENSTQYIVSDISGTDGDITLDFTAVAQFGFTFLDGSTVSTGSLTGTIVEGTSLEGEYSVATGESGTVSMTYNAIYERDSSFEKLAGMWDEEFGVLTFDADGSFFEQDSFGCVFDGQAEIIDAQYNAYALSMTVSLCGEDFDGEYAGLAILVDFEATDDMLIIQMNSDELILTTSLLRL